MAYIISCSGRKICPLLNPNSKPSTIEKLSFNDELLNLRLQNIENPDQYPMKLDNDNDGMWNELFIAYLESNNV